MKRWLLVFLTAFPFTLFLLGYGLPSLFFTQKSGECPSVVGQTMLEAIKPLSAYPLNVRIVGEEEHDELAEGTILRQQPYPGQRIKPHQSIYLVVSRTQKTPVMPLLNTMNIDDLTDNLKKQNVHLKTYTLNSILPTGDIISLMPHPGLQISNKERTGVAYLSGGTTPLRILPSFVGYSVSIARESLPTEKIEIKVIRNLLAYDDIRPDDQLKIVEQKPLAGSIVDISKPLVVYVIVE